MAELHKHIYDMYNIPLLNIVGFGFYKNDIRRKLIKLNILSVEQLERDVTGGGLVLLIPNQDLPVSLITRPVPNVSRQFM